MLLWILGWTSFFEGYDRSIVILALPQIRESFGLSQAAASLWLVALFVSALPAMPVTRLADRIGRRSVLLWSIGGYTLATAFTAASPSILVFVGLQFLARMFINAESAIVATMTAEELPAPARGFGFGFLGMMQSLGVGLAALLYGTAFAPADISWRWMYLVGVPPLLVIAWFRRRLPESRRFETAREDGLLVDRWHAILRRPHRRWLILVVITGFLVELVTQATVFAIDFLQTERGLTATDSNLMLVAAGLPGIPAMVVAGSLSDRYGRRVVGCSFAALSLTGALCFFWLPGGIPVLLPSMVLMVVGSMASWPVLSTYTTELFPTALRSQAGAWAACFRVLGQATSLGLGGALLVATGSLPPTVTLLGVGPLLAVVIYAIWFPDTHGKELEEISGPGPLGPSAVSPVE